MFGVYRYFRPRDRMSLDSMHAGARRVFGRAFVRRGSAVSTAAALAAAAAIWIGLSGCSSAQSRQLAGAPGGGGEERLERGGAGRGGGDMDRSIGMFVGSEPAARGRRGVAAEDRRLVGGGSVALRRLDLSAGRGLSGGDLSVGGESRGLDDHRSEER